MTTQQWKIEIYGGGNFPKFFDRIGDAERAVVQAAIEHVLVPKGIDICSGEWGKNLGHGLYELRIRRTLETLLREHGHPGAISRVPNSWLKKRILLRIYCTFYGDKIILLLGGYNKLRNPSVKQEQKEIKAARAAMSRWRAEQKY